MENLDQILEGLLFVAGDPIDKSIIIEKLQIDKKDLDEAIDILKNKYDKETSGITLLCIKNKIQLSSNGKFADPISVVINPIREKKLSKSTLEVAAIVAYKQPITRLEIEEIRGVNSDYAIQTLMENSIIEVVGRKDAIGRPLLFGTTDEFLKRFDLESLDDLPDYEQLLASIKDIESFDNSLYNNFEIPDEEEPSLDMESAYEAIKSGDLVVDDKPNKDTKSDDYQEIQALEELSEEDKLNSQLLDEELKDAKIIESDDTETDEKFVFDGMDDEIPEFLQDDDNIEIIDSGDDNE